MVLYWQRTTYYALKHQTDWNCYLQSIDSRDFKQTCHYDCFTLYNNTQIGWHDVKRWTLLPAGTPLSSGFRCYPLWSGTSSHALCSQWQPDWTVLPGRESGEHRGSSSAVSITHLPLCWLWYVLCTPSTNVMQLFCLFVCVIYCFFFLFKIVLCIWTNLTKRKP